MTFYRFRRTCLRMGNRIVQPVSAAHTFIPLTFLRCLHIVFPGLTAFIFRIFSCFLIMNVCFYLLLSLHFLTLNNWRIGTVYVFDLSALLLYFLFVCFAFPRNNVSFFSDKKRVVLFSIEYFLGFFVTGLIFKSLKEVISSGEMSERRIVLRVLNEASAEIGNTFWKMGTEVAGTQSRATFVDAVSIEVLAQQVSEMENKYSGTMLQLEG